MLIHKNLEEFSAALATAQPVMPGGGCAAAAAGLMAVGLVEMAINMDTATDRDPALLRRMQLTHRCLLECVDADAAAYNELLAAMNLTANGANEEVLRETKIQCGLELAAKTPLQTATACLQTAEAGLLLLAGSPGPAAADLQIAVLLARASAQGAIQMAALNLAGLADETGVPLREEISILTARLEQINGKLIPIKQK